eukprot:gene11943-8526_t
MSFKGSKIQPTRIATLAVQSVDSVDDNASVSSTNLPGLSYRPQVPVDDIFNSPSLPRRKRRQTYAAPNSSNSNNNNNNNNTSSSNGGSGGQSAGIAANPHAKYARTLGNVSDAQSQTTLLAPPKLKNRAKSFSAGDRLAADDGGSSNNNARQAQAQLQRRPSAGGHANNSAQTLSRANSRSSLSARKKRVAWRNPLVDDRLDSEASVKFARAYSGAGPSFFGRSASQSRLAVGDDLSSASVDDNNSTGSAGSSGGRHKKRSKRHSGSGGAAGGKRSWLSWLNVFSLFSPRTARPSAAESNAKAAAYSADSSSSSASSSSGGGSGGVTGGESKQTTDDSVVDFSLSLVQLETKLGAAALQPAPLPSSDGSGKPRTARSSLLFLAWRQALNAGPAPANGSGKVRPF